MYHLKKNLILPQFPAPIDPFEALWEEKKMIESYITNIIHLLEDKNWRMLKIQVLVTPCAHQDS